MTDLQPLIDTIKTHFLAADADTRALYRITPRQQELLDRTPVTAEIQHGGMMSISSYWERKKYGGIQICYNDELTPLFDDRALGKIIVHEFGHFFQETGPYIPAHIIGTGNRVSEFFCENPLTRAAVGMSMAVGGLWMAGTMTHSMAPHTQVSATLFGAGLGFYAGNALYTWPSRLCEDRADDLADRVMPEITWARAMKPLRNKIETPISRFEDQAYYMTKTHPSFQTRFAKSELRCGTYGAIKKDNNIPTLEF